jgi:hypothetical protein
MPISIGLAVAGIEAAAAAVASMVAAAAAAVGGKVARTSSGLGFVVWGGTCLPIRRRCMFDCDE